jgi:hypothetical protein
MNYAVTPQQIIKATWITFENPNYAYGLAKPKAEN